MKVIALQAHEVAAVSAGQAMALGFDQGRV